MDKYSSYDAKLQAALEKLQIATEEVSKVIADHKREHKDSPLEIALTKDMIKRKTGKEPTANTAEGIILEFYYDRLIEIIEEDQDENRRRYPNANR